MNRGLIFIPDISGFTRFVNNTEIEHSRLIIQELLEILINSNQIGLEISEIEGDAILFYRFGEPPPLEDLYQQVNKMFCDFHRNLIAYEQRRYCYCAACNAAIALTLKVITHYGEFTGYNVKNFNKLIGKDIIVAHQLLKNDIEKHEYWLITNDVTKEQPARLTDWMRWMNSAKMTDNGEVPYHYTYLTTLKENLPPEEINRSVLANKKKVLSVKQEYDADIISLFHTTGDFRYRNKWLVGVERVEEVGHYLPRVGMKCKCTYTNGKVGNFTSNSYSFSPEKIQFTETDEDGTSRQYILEKITDGRTTFTVDHYIEKNLGSSFNFLFRKGKIKRDLQASLENLHAVDHQLS